MATDELENETPLPPDEEPVKKARQPSPVEKLLKESVHYSKVQDDLLDIHVGNPLRRITKILEEIKKQKAFSFTLKGSLGVMGVALVLGTFGVFGGEKLLCNKGVQSKIGMVKVLQVSDPETSTLFLVGNLVDWLNTFTGKVRTHSRVILVEGDGGIVSIPYVPTIDVESYSGQGVVATGDYDACSETLKVTSPTGIETVE